MWFPAAARAANVAVDTLDAQPAILALDDVRRAWLDQLRAV